MANRNKTSLNDKTSVAIIGLVASLIAIFVFLTGKSSISDIFPKETQMGIPTQQKEKATSTIVASSISTPQPENTIVPAATVMHENVNVDYPGLSARITDFTQKGSTVTNYSGQIVLRPIVGEGANSYVLNKPRWFLDSVVKDISGKWQINPNGGSTGLQMNNDGSMNILFTEAMTDSGLVTIYFHDMRGCWAEGDFPYPIVPVYKNKTTEVDFHFALLEIGLLDKNNNAVKKGTAIEIGVERKSIDGNHLIENCGPYGNIVAFTDARGVAQFIVVSGDYFFRIRNSRDDWSPAVTVTSGEYKQVILNEP